MDKTDIVDLINCSICLEPFDDPRALPCLHTFCLKCLKPMEEESEPGEQLKCPMCRASFDHPKGGFTNLPPNLYAKKVQQRLASDSKPDTLSVDLTKSCMGMHGHGWGCMCMPAFVSPTVNPLNHAQKSNDAYKAQQRISRDNRSDTSSIACTRSCQVEMSASVSPTVNAPDPVRESSDAKQVQQRISNDSQPDTSLAACSSSCMIEMSVFTSPTVFIPDHTHGSVDKISSSHQEIPVTIGAGYVITD